MSIMYKSSYEVPEELQILMIESDSLENLRNLYVKTPLGYKNALKCSKKMEKLRHDFWCRLYKLYPELECGKLSYGYGKIYTNKKDIKDD